MHRRQRINHCFEPRPRTFVGKVLHVYSSSSEGVHEANRDGHFVLMLNYDDLFVFLTPEGRASILRGAGGVQGEQVGSPVPQLALAGFLPLGRLVRVRGRLQVAPRMERFLQCTSCVLLPEKKKTAHDPHPHHHHHHHLLLDDSGHVCDHQRRRMWTRQMILCPNFSIDPSTPCPDRFCPLRHYFISSREEFHVQQHRGHKKAMKEMHRDVNDPWDERKKKGLQYRHHLTADFVLATFGKRMLLGQDREADDEDWVVLDVAGGHGNVSRILWERYDVKSIVIDPMFLDEEEESDDEDEDEVGSRRRRQQQLQGRFVRPPIPKYREERLRIRFDDEFVQSAEGKKLMDRCTLVIGLHPDEATESIVEIAARFNKPVCIIPCCVHSRQPDISHHEEFVERLKRLAEGKIKRKQRLASEEAEGEGEGSRQDDDEVEVEEEEVEETNRVCRTGFLNMKGRNKVLYVLPENIERSRW